MTAVPLPDIPCVRVEMSGVDDTANDWGIRFFLSYAGTAPTGANCTTLAGDVEAAWAADIAPLQHPTVLLTEVDVLDIATDTGLSGQWNGSLAGSATGNILPIQVAMDVEYGIARRYRGGKPRTYLPIGTYNDLADQGHWDASFVTATNTAVTSFFTAIQALVVGAMGALTHVSLSYYKGFTNITNSSGRERAVPTYRPVALHDNVTGYAAKVVLGSQKRRRTATAK
jgi:hypothetical protein